VCACGCVCVCVCMCVCVCLRAYACVFRVTLCVCVHGSCVRSCAFVATYLHTVNAKVHLDVGGCPVTISDTAGLRATTDAVESLGVERARGRLAGADLALLVFDRLGFPDSASAEALALAGLRAPLVVFNKCDVASGPPTAAELDYLQSRGLSVRDAVWVSCRTLEGVEELVRVLGERAQGL
jgi:tRNA U34 5-carboxymethylaminomethyl modifying GTPase MnmE/TrmE